MFSFSVCIYLRVFASEVDYCLYSALVRFAPDAVPVCGHLWVHWHVLKREDRVGKKMVEQ